MNLLRLIPSADLTTWTWPLMLSLMLLFGEAGYVASSYVSSTVTGTSHISEDPQVITF